MPNSSNLFEMLLKVLPKAHKRAILGYSLIFLIVALGVNWGVSAQFEIDLLKPKLVAGFMALAGLIGATGFYDSQNQANEALNAKIDSLQEQITAGKKDG